MLLAWNDRAESNYGPHQVPPTEEEEEEEEEEVRTGGQHLGDEELQRATKGLEGNLGIVKWIKGVLQRVDRWLDNGPFLTGSEVERRRTPLPEDEQAYFDVSGTPENPKGRLFELWPGRDKRDDESFHNGVLELAQLGEQLCLQIVQRSQRGPGDLRSIVSFGFSIIPPKSDDLPDDMRRIALADSLDSERAMSWESDRVPSKSDRAVLLESDPAADLTWSLLVPASETKRKRYDPDDQHSHRFKRHQHARDNVQFRAGGNSLYAESKLAPISPSDGKAHNGSRESLY